MKNQQQKALKVHFSPAIPDPEYTTVSVSSDALSALSQGVTRQEHLRGHPCCLDKHLYEVQHER